ncbi:MAG: radical SAM protein [Asgard group archaeon]|nr:radical SAM protein [Asgard group archaeon]
MNTVPICYYAHGKPYFYLQFHINTECNLRCKHCYQETYEGKEDSQLSSEEINDIIEQFHNFSKIMGLRGVINFTGGEPLLDKKFEEYIKNTRERQMIAKVLSNGTLFSDTRAKSLKEADLNVVQVSIDGLRETHDNIRGEGAFDEALEGLKNCIANDLQTTVMMTVNKKNMYEVEPLVKLCTELGVKRFGCARMIPIGHGALMKDESLTKEDVKQFFKYLVKVVKKYQKKIEFVIHDPVWLAYRKIRNSVGCSVGQFGLTVMHNGDIMPCRRMNTVIGNVRENNFLEIWHSDYFEPFRNRRLLEEQCSSCKSVKFCGGCRAIAKGVTGNELAGDPHCFVYKGRK